MRRYTAHLATGAGLLVIFCGLALISPVAAFIITAGALLVALGLFAIEVP